MTAMDQELNRSQVTSTARSAHTILEKAIAREARLRSQRRAKNATVKARIAGMIDERSRLARELHDTLLHGVTAIALEAEAALPNVHASPERALRTLERIIELAERSGRETRLAVSDIRQPMLKNGDFLRAVEAAAEGLVAGTAIALRTRTTGRLCQLSPDRQSVILRVVQEAVTNAVRHSAAGHVLVTLSYGTNDVSVSVTDDGVGVGDTRDLPARAGHWGLIGMRERAERVGGRVTLRSAPGEGTTIELVLPYHGTIAPGRWDASDLRAQPGDV